MAHSGVALSGSLERHAFLRRHSHHRPAVDRAALSKQERARLLAVFTPQYDKKPYDIIRDYWSGNQQTAEQQSASSRSSSAADRQEQAAELADSQAAAADSSRQRDFRKLVAQVCARWVCSEHGAAGEDCFRKRGCLARECGQDARGPSEHVAQRSGGQGVRTRVSHRPDNLRRPLCKQRLVAGIAEAAFESHLGQRRADQSKHGEATRSRQKRSAERAATFTSTRSKITHQGRTISDAVPTWIMPGQPDGVITIHLGYGRTHAGRVGNEHGLQCLRDSHLRFALVGERRAG